MFIYTALEGRGAINIHIESFPPIVVRYIAKALFFLF